METLCLQSWVSALVCRASSPAQAVSLGWHPHAMLQAVPCPGALGYACAGLRVVFLLRKKPPLPTQPVFNTLEACWGQHLVARPRCALPFDGSPSQGSRRMQGYPLTERFQLQVTQILCVLLCVAFFDVLGGWLCVFLKKKGRCMYLAFRKVSSAPAPVDSSPQVTCRV